ncbi:hypothetical protein V6N12_064982 [Hibiscus sabdariffa]|uniref:Uncharacterized protein n=1 Tax=Hibiscus sabdariffa TaxID=183260 RepID=A0ABR2G7I9_9ROSI
MNWVFKGRAVVLVDVTNIEAVVENSVRISEGVNNNGILHNDSNTKLTQQWRLERKQSTEACTVRLRRDCVRGGLEAQVGAMERWNGAGPVN